MISAIKVSEIDLSLLEWICLFQIHGSKKISTLAVIESEWNFLPPSSAKSLCFLDPLSRWFVQSCQLKVSESHLLISSTKYLSFSIDDRQWSRQCCRSIAAETDLSRSRLNLSFCRSTVDNFSDIVADREVSGIHLSVSSRKSLSFLDPWSTMFCTFWLMERRMGWPLLLTKLSSRSPTTEVPSTADIR